MSRPVQLLLLAAALAAAAHVHGDDSQDRFCLRDEFPRGAARLELGALFRQPAQAAETSDGVSLRSGSMEVVVARIGTDGKPVMACVDTEEAAIHFFGAPVERIPTKRPVEK